MSKIKYDIYNLSLSLSLSLSHTHTHMHTHTHTHGAAKTPGTGSWEVSTSKLSTDRKEI